MGAEAGDDYEAYDSEDGLALLDEEDGLNAKEVSEDSLLDMFHRIAEHEDIWNVKMIYYSKEA
ncbi:MAG: hypothetical protein AAF514_01630 [Verrucomicrobiota bacterium]